MTYDQAFFDSVTEESLPGAKVIMPWVIEVTHAERVIDVGCGPAAWAAMAQEAGCQIHAVDGFISDAQLLINEEEFELADLSQGIDCTGYDLAVCLEVGEHLAKSSATALVQGLAKAKYVLFSAAIPNQGGNQHINEQWQSYWADLFAKTGMVANCDVRWKFWDDVRVQPYYRQNMVLYSKAINLAAIGLEAQKVTNVVHPDFFTYKYEALTLKPQSGDIKR